MQEVTGTALAAHLFCTRETISDYVENGVIAKLRDGKYDVDECRKRVLRHLRDKAAGRLGGAEGASLSREKALLAKEQRETASLKNAMTRGDLISIRLIIKGFTGDLTVLRERLLTIPGKVADDLEGRTRAEIEEKLIDEISEALTALSDPRTYADGRGGVHLGEAGGVQGSPPAAPTLAH